MESRDSDLVPDNFADIARKKIKQAKQTMGLTTRQLYLLLYEEEGSDHEVQQLTNRLNRGSISAAFLGLCVQKMPPLHDVTLSQFFRREM